ncbi:MAG: endonuclease/exonuclease/phosphatase family protein [Bacteroidaceae bacterium]|nr:endonuclease/exonuclease/phosphatase family protein [Bacteroidaceae bacterium]
MKELFKRFSVSLFLGANIFTILLLWLSVGMTFISPDVFPRLSLLTLAFPIFLLVDLLFVIFWLLFKARLVWVPLAGALLVGGYVLDYCPIHFSSNGETNDSTLTIISYNVGYMKEEQFDSQFIQLVNTTDADIICLQELGKYFLKRHKDWLDSTAYKTLQAGNVVILSRYPLLSDTIHINFPTRSNHCFACWIDYEGDSLLVVNGHLESNHLSSQEKDEYTNTIIDPNREAIKSSSKMLLDKLSEAAAYRGAQTDSICAFLERNPGRPTIVCGDFNDTPISYAYQRLDRHLSSAYREAGNGLGFTYTRRSFPVRIDHLFFSDMWTCTSCYTDRAISASDHYPLVARLSKKVR